MGRCTDAGDETWEVVLNQETSGAQKSFRFCNPALVGGLNPAQGIQPGAVINRVLRTGPAQEPSGLGLYHWITQQNAPISDQAFFFFP
jgi:hypothetical protein